MKSARWWRIVAMLLTLSLIAAACGDDDDEDATAGTDTTAAEDGGDGGEDGGEGGDGTAAGDINMDEELEIAEGTVLPLPDCPGDWDPEAGLTDTTIKIAMSLPESGPVATLAGLDDGMQAWLDHGNDGEPVEIDGRTFEVVSADDGFDPARTVSNTEEFLARDEPFALTWMIGTANNAAIRDLTDEECVPQLFNSTGHPQWGDPENYPWTMGGLISYNTESQMWCSYIEEELGPDTTVAALFMDNDFGLAYQEAIQNCADEGQIDLVEEVTHDPAAPDVTGAITTLAASNADVVVLGTTGAPCPQAMAALASSSWNPTTFLSNTCAGIPTYFTPVDPDGEGVIVATVYKEVSDEEDPDVQAATAALEAAGLDPFSGAYYTGIIFGMMVEQLFLQAAEMEGGLNRVNLMRAAWNADIVNPLFLDGATLRTDGANDAYLVEAAQFAEYVPPAAGEEAGTYEPIGELLDQEGQTGAFGG